MGICLNHTIAHVATVYYLKDIYSRCTEQKLVELQHKWITCLYITRHHKWFRSLGCQIIHTCPCSHLHNLLNHWALTLHNHTFLQLFSVYDVPLPHSYVIALNLNIIWIIWADYACMYFASTTKTLVTSWMTWESCMNHRVRSACIWLTKQLGWWKSIQFLCQQYACQWCQMYLLGHLC